MKPFMCILPTKTYVGAGALENLSEEMTSLGRKAMLVTEGEVMRKTGIMDKVKRLIESAGVEVYLEEGVMPNPRSSYIDEAVERFDLHNCDFTVGLGGGSSMDAAKAIAFVAANGGKMEDYLPGGIKEAFDDVKDAYPSVAIATTAGTGSEVTKFAVITNMQTNEKPGIGHDSMFPKIAVVDSELMTTVPGKVTANTGVDVLFHAMEAYISNIATPMSDLCAAESIRLVLGNLGTAIQDGSDIEARTAMAWASTLAGIAIFNATTVGIHGMGHPVGGHTDAPHGLTMAAIGPAFMKATWDSDIRRYAQVTKMLGFGDETLSEEALAEKSGEALEIIMKRFGTDVTISDLGVKEDMIPQLAKDAFSTMGGCMEASLKPLDISQVEDIYRDAL